MNHKGLIYTATGIVIIGIMSAIIAFSLNPGGERTIYIESFPSGAEVYLDGEKIGETPLALDKKFFQAKGYSIENYALARIFSHELSYIELAAPEHAGGNEPSKKLKKGQLSFVTKSASASVPKVFDGAKPLNEMGPLRRDVELMMRLPNEDRIVAVFNKERLPQMSADRKMTAEVTVFAPPLQQAGVAMSEFKSCTVKTSSEFRKPRK